MKTNTRRRSGYVPFIARRKKTQSSNMLFCTVAVSSFGAALMFASVYLTDLVR